MTSRRPLDRGHGSGTPEVPVLPVEEPPFSVRQSGPKALPYTEESEIWEAAENFKAYLEILREWDEKERQMPDQSSRD